MRIGIAGYKGRVGQLLVRELQSGEWPGLTLSAGSSRSPGSEAFPVVENARDLMNACDCAIDFTTPAGTRAHVQAAVEAGTAIMIGTTGLESDLEAEIRKAAATIPIVQAANTSIGVTILLALIEQAAARLGPEWDIEIFESHHRHKIDAPSGTALALGRAVRAGRGSGDFVTDREGKRKAGDIGYAVTRGGDVVGEHMVIFYGAGERLELGHRASDRALFARGALRAAQWLDGKPPGLYTMRDVLGL